MSRPIVEALFGSGAKSKLVQLLSLRKENSDPWAARPLAREAGVALGSINKTLAELVKDQRPEGPRRAMPPVMTPRPS